MPYIKKIAKIAQSENNRDALNNWDKFRLPVAKNDRIEALLDRLRSEPSSASPTRRGA